MHELGMCEGVLAAVEQRAQGRPVDQITVRVGTLLRVEPEAFALAFEMVAAGGPADGATTEVVVVPVRGTCAECHHEFESFDPVPVCPMCAAVDIARDGGDDLVLESIRYRPSTSPQR